MSIVGDMYEGGGAKPVSWHDIGQTVQGEIVAIRTRQLPKFGTEIPETWPDGSPKMTPIVTVQTEVFEDDDDDGRRDIYLRNNAFTVFGKALREAYRSKPSDDELIGAELKIQFNQTQPTTKGQPRKLFRAKITPRSSVADVWDDEAPAPPAAPADAQPPTNAAPVTPPHQQMPPAPPHSDADIPF